MAEDLEQLKTIGQKKFQDQAVWMLNAMWFKEKDARAEELWSLVSLFASLEQENGKEGCGLDEVNMHRVFEKLNAQQTFQEMRNHMRKVGVTSFKKISMINFLIFHFGYDWKEVVNAPQGGNIEGIEKAKKMLEDVTIALESATKKAEESKAAAEESRKKTAEAKSAATEATKKAEESKEKAEEAAKKVEEADQTAKVASEAADVAKKDEDVAIARQKEAQAAEDEVTKALNEVKSQEDAKENKKVALKKKIETAGLVAKNAAIQELAKLEDEDDLPLRRAKMTLEAAQRKAAKPVKIATEAREKASATAQQALDAKNAADEAKAQAEEAQQQAENALKAFNEAKAQAEEAQAQSEEAEKQAEEAAQAAEEAVQDANNKVAEAEAYLEEQKKKAEGSGQGAIWFMQREVTEKKKFMPVRKGGIVKK
uniref:Tropomyosin, putative n=1 Tax=Entamoeba invadens TaxID=33085 RepID=S0AZZ3_ENTIV|nr:tropomyosin, putative [Entamoeba invadens]BAN41217.1 tropomyosin, putative [Entamoeba invadens]